MDSSGWQKFSLTLSTLTLILLSVYALFQSPVRAFEVNLYNGFPDLYWTLFLLTVIAAGCTVYLSIETREYLRSGGLVLVSAWLLFLALPKLRGYLLYGRSNADILAHLGYTRTILEEGHLFQDDFYPLLHILMSWLRQIGIGFWELRTVIAVIFTPLFVLGVFFYMRSFDGHRSAVFAMIVAGIPFFGKFHATVQPSVISFMIAPFVFWFVERYRRNGEVTWALLLFITLLAEVWFHLGSALYMMLALFVYAVVTNVREGGWLRRESSHGGGTKPLSFRFVALMTIPLGIWSLASGTIQRVLGVALLNILYLANITGANSAILFDQLTASSSRGLTGYQTVVRFVELYGAIVIIGLIAVFVSIAILRKYWARGEYPGSTLLTAQYITGLLVALPIFLLPIVISSAVRAGRYAILFAILLVGFGLAKMVPSLRSFSFRRKDGIATLVVVLLLVSALSIATLNLYKPNYHLTEKEHRGVEWTLENHDRSERIWSLALGFKHADAIQGRHDSRADRRSFFWRFNTARPDLFPQRLGYRKNGTIAETFGTGYLVTKAHDTSFYTWFFANQKDQLAYYTERDVKRLHADTTVNKYYVNGGYALWRIP